MTERTLEVLDKLLAARAQASQFDEALTDAFANAASLCADRLRGLNVLATEFAFEGVELEQVGESGRYADVGAAAKLTIRESDASILVTVDRPCCSALAELMLGGQGSSQRAIQDRSPTSIELQLVHLFFESFEIALSEALSLSDDRRLLVEMHADEISLEEFLGPEQQFVLVAYRLQFNQSNGRVELLMPLSFVEELQHIVTISEGDCAADEGSDWSTQMQSKINQAEVSLTATFDQSRMPLGDISKFKVGQFIPLEVTADSPVFVQCDGVPLMECSFGQSNGVYTLMVDRFIGPKPGPSGFDQPA